MGGNGGRLHNLPLFPPAVFVYTLLLLQSLIPSTLALCHGIGYKQMRIPNLLGHDSLREAQQQSAAWMPLISKLCHKDTKKFLCSLFAPVCLPELSAPVNPCRSLCEAVRDGCVPVMSAFGFPWPEMFNCSRFPRGTELCIPATGEGDTWTDEELRNEEVLRGTVICDACSLAAEGETDIQENFCQSPYAFKMRLGSVSAVGGDRQLVPTPRSRILRWAGGGAEKAEGIGEPFSVFLKNDSILDAFDTWCTKVEFISNIGPKKGKILDRLMVEQSPLTVLELEHIVATAQCGWPGSCHWVAEFTVLRWIREMLQLQRKLFVELIVSPSDEVIPRLRSDYGLERLDFVFMDHWKRSYLPDLQMLEGSGLLGKGSIILADNVLFPGAPKFLRHLRKSGLYEWKIHRATLEYSKGIRDGMAELIYYGTK
ncbi:hypothetical protein WMY93_029473 [Mugilogobius chulae]|uniref:FZ domain-containing protein n=1 Tax=Mugilogobius chulae TaxID=88201 RepID=A0AAW0N291_9GOBI